MYSKRPGSFKKRSAAHLPQKSIISAQFVKIVEFLIADGREKSYATLLQKYGYERSMINHINLTKACKKLRVLANKPSFM